jgi:branched-chain amino acid transport system substrate-binding protein
MTLNRRQFTQGATALAAASAWPLARAADTVKIGYVSPQTGPLAPFGEADRWVIDQMKAAFKDGLAIGGKKHDEQIILKASARWCRGSRGSSAARATLPRVSSGRITSSGAWKT